MWCTWLIWHSHTEVLFALCCESLHAFRMLARRHEPMLAASRASPSKVHSLNVSICKCRSCCRREFQALSFAAVCAAAKDGLNVLLPFTFSQPLVKSEGSLSYLSLTCVIAHFVMIFTALTDLFSSSSWLPRWPFSAAFFSFDWPYSTLISAFHMLQLYCLFNFAFNGSIWINFDHQIHSCCLRQGSA